MSKEAGKAKGVKNTASIQNLGTSRLYEINNYSSERKELRAQFDASVSNDYVFGKLPEDHEYAVALKAIEARHEKRMKALDVKGQRIINKEPMDAD